jgi:hypothetical protein
LPVSIIWSRPLFWFVFQIRNIKNATIACTR